MTEKCNHVLEYGQGELLCKNCFNKYIEKSKVRELKKKCCHHNMFGWGCTSTTGLNAPNGEPLPCRSCQDFEELGLNEEKVGE